MSLNQVLPAEPVHFFCFRATQSGKYFYGYCSQVCADEQRVTFSDRKLRRYFFEPGDIEPRIELKNAGSLSLLKKDFHVIAVVAAPPLWLCAQC